MFEFLTEDDAKSIDGLPPTVEGVRIFHTFVCDMVRDVFGRYLQGTPSGNGSCTRRRRKDLHAGKGSFTPPPPFGLGT